MNVAHRCLYGIRTDEEECPCGYNYNPPTSDTWTHDPMRDGAGCGWCGAYAQVNDENLCRKCFEEES